MSNRDIIFGKIRAGLKSGRNDTARQSVVDARIAAQFRHPTPARVARRSHLEHVALFKHHMTGQSATVVDAATPAEIPGLIADYLRQNNLPARVVHGADDYLAALPWTNEPALERRLGRAQPADDVSVSHAQAAVAETGTLVLTSGPDNPVTLNFLPETHIVVVQAKNVVGPYEDAWMKIRARFGGTTMPRTVNMIGGPSRTGDIGGRIVMGAHGPRRMCVVVVHG